MWKSMWDGEALSCTLLGAFARIKSVSVGKLADIVALASDVFA
jgi:hypothetical protein